MLRSATQDFRQLAVFTPFGKDVLLLESFVGEEALSELSEFRLRMISSESDLDPRQILGRNITFRVDRENSNSRFFNGYVRSFSIVDATDRMFVYEASVVPWLWFLTNTSDCRIFQKKTTPEIIEQIFRDLGFDDFDFAFLSGNYQERDYCVQYRESDFDFVSRLMEEEGIYYYFVHENGKHTLVLADTTSGYYGIDEDEVSIADRTQQGGLSTDVFEWRHGKRMLTGAWASTDYNYSQPRTDLGSVAPSAIPALSAMQLERFDFPGRFSQPAEGRGRVQIRMEEEEAKHEWVAASGVRATFSPGGIFEVAKHPNASEVGRKYAIRRVRYTAGAVGGYTSGEQDAELPWLTEFEGIPQSVVFRPERKTPRPIVEGPQTAVVVGPSGEEIYTDEDGRIKVQFHWDREGSRDENSSCWIRVSQVHAGAGWGAMHIPRIGEEVIVSFLEGDPDQPVVKGRVYNGAARVPFGLPDEMTRSGGKSNTHKGSGYNEMSMDDTAGKEQLRTNAQHNMDTTVGNSQTLGVGVDRSESIGNNDALTVGVDKTVDVGNNLTEAVGNNENLIAGNNVVLKAGTAITLKCGLSTIHMNQAGIITISGQYVSSLAAATNTIVAPMTEIAGSTMLNQAGAICMDLSGVKHIKAKETSVSGAAVEVNGKGITIIKGAPIKLGEAGAPMATIPAPTSAPGGGGPGSPSGPASTSSASGDVPGETTQTVSEATSPGKSAEDSQKNATTENKEQTPSGAAKSVESGTDDSTSPQPSAGAGEVELAQSGSGAKPGENGENDGFQNGKAVDAVASGGDATSDSMLKESQKAHQQATEAARGDAAAAQTEADAARANADAKQTEVKSKATEARAAAAGDDLKGGMKASAEKAKLDVEQSQLENKASSLESKASEMARAADDIEAKAPTKSTAGKVLTAADKVLKVKTAVEKGVEAGEKYAQGDTRGAFKAGGEGMGNIAGGDAGAVAGAWLGAKTSLLCGPYAPVCAVVTVPVGAIGGAYIGAEVGEKVGGAAAGAGYDFVTGSDSPPPAQPATPPPPPRSPITIPPGECFAGDVLVHMAVGTKPISELSVGDEVVSWDERENSTVLARITRVSENPALETLELVFASGSVHTTTRHRWHAAERGWQAAGKLRPKDTVTTLDDKEALLKIQTHPSPRLVYNLEVEHHHNYFVGSGYLVHNAVRHSGNVLK